MTAAIVARVDAGALEELVALREDYPCLVREFGILAVARCFIAAGDISPDALALAEQLNDPLGILEQSTVPPFAEAYPALARWRATVRNKVDPSARLEAAAAWELSALECDARGEERLADTAREAAARALQSRRRSA